jgi:hypothetical protein
LQYVVTNTWRIRYRGERWIHRPDTDEEAGVDDVRVVEFMRLATGVEHGTFWIGSEAAPAAISGLPCSRSEQRWASSFYRNQQPIP